MIQPPDIIHLRARPETLYIYEGESLLVTGQDGRIDGAGMHGLYFRNARVLSCWELHIDGERPRFAAASAVDSYSMLSYYLGPQVQRVGGLEPEERGLTVRVACFCGDGLHEDVVLENYTQADLSTKIAWAAAADFADFAEAQSGERKQCAPVDASWEEGALVFRYRHDALPLAARVRVTGCEPSWDGERVHATVTLAPREQRHICVSVEPLAGREFRRPRHACFDFRQPAPEAWHDATRIETSNAAVQAAWTHGIADLRGLALSPDRWPEVMVPAAGVPGYQALFGRDILTAAWQAAMAHPAMMEATIDVLAARQGSRYDGAHDEQPGRIVQQVNLGPLAQLGLTPYGRYFGDFASPPAFLLALGQHFAWTGDSEMLRRYEPAADAVLRWIERDADRDGDGFIEYQSQAEGGLRNQGWKDSSMALVDEHGNGVPTPIAACDLQAYVYAGKQQYAIAIAAGRRRFADARRLLGEAAQLKRRFNDAFWMPEHGFMAFALDSQKRQVRSIASNPGHCLAAGIIAPEYARAVAERLMAPDMFSGWGIRTLSTEHPSFNPLSYQLGSVWPVECATIAFGLKRYGFHDEANRIAQGFFDAASLFPHHRLPEVIGGFARDAEHPHPGIYAQAQCPQAWSASAVVLMLQAVLGSRPFAPLGVLFVDPVLPSWLPELTLHDLRVGGATVSIRFRREADGTTAWKVLRRTGTLRVVQQPPESSVDATPADRLLGAVRSLVPALH